MIAAPSVVAPADDPSPHSNDGCVNPSAIRKAAHAKRSSILLTLFSKIAYLCQSFPLSLPPLMWANANTHPFSRAFK